MKKTYWKKVIVVKRNGEGVFWGGVLCLYHVKKQLPLGPSYSKVQNNFCFNFPGLPHVQNKYFIGPQKNSSCIFTTQSGLLNYVTGMWWSYDMGKID